MAVVTGQHRQVSVLGTDLGEKSCCGVLDYSFDKRALQHQTSNACLAWNGSNPAPKCYLQCTVWQSMRSYMGKGPQPPCRREFLLTIALPSTMLCHRQYCHLSQDRREDFTGKAVLTKKIFLKFILFHLAQPFEYRCRYSGKKNKHKHLRKYILCLFSRLSIGKTCFLPTSESWLPWFCRRFFSANPVPLVRCRRLGLVHNGFLLV